MARDEARVRVRLDTRRAKSDLRGLTKTAAGTAGRVGARLRGAVGRGLGAVGLGGGVAAGLAATRASTASGFGDVIGEVFGGIGAQLNELFLGKLDEEARANKGAREDTYRAFGLQAGITERTPPGAINWFNQRKAFLLQEELGKTRLERALPRIELDDVLTRVLDGLSKLLSEAVSALADKLNFGLFK